MYKLMKFFEYVWPFLVEELSTRDTDSDKTKKRKGALFGLLLFLFITLNPTENVGKSIEVLKSYIGREPLDTLTKENNNIVDYLTEELTSKAELLARLRVELNEVRIELEQSQEDNLSLKKRLLELEQMIAALKENIDELKSKRRREISDRIDRLHDLQRD